MNLDEFDLQFLSGESEPKRHKTESEGSAHQQLANEEIPDLFFLLTPDSISDKPPLIQTLPDHEIDPQVITAQSEQLLNDLGVSQAVDQEPLDMAQKWSMDPSNRATEQLDRNWPDNAESERGPAPGSAEITERDPEFGLVPTDIDPPLILEGEDSLFGEDEALEPKVVQENEPDIGLAELASIESLVGSQEFEVQGEKESPFVDSEEPLVLPDEPHTSQDYDSLLSQIDDAEPQVVHETLNLDPGALPDFADIGLADSSDEIPSEPTVVLESVRPENSDSLTPISPDEPLLLYENGESPFEDHPEEEQPAEPAPNQTTQQDQKSSFSMSSLFSNTQLVGIDIGATSIKYAVLKKAGRSFKLVNCGMRALPPEHGETDGDSRADRVANILKNEFQLKSYKNSILTSAVSGLEVIYKNIQVPKMGSKELAKAVPWACRKDFPFPIESTIFEYSVIGDKTTKANEKLNVYVAAAQKEMVLNHVNLIRKSDSLPAKVSTVPSALWNLFLTMDKKYHSGCYAVIDIGGKSSHIVFLNNGQLQFAREISTGGDDITEVLTGSIFVSGEEISISKEKAEGIKRKYGYLEKVNIESQEEVIPLKEITVMMNPVLEKLTKEVQRTTDFFKEKFGIESIEKTFITGGTALLKNIPAYLSNELNTEVDVLNPFETISAKKFSNHEDLKQLGPRLAVALGLAIDKQKDLNLLPSEIRGAQASQNAKRLFRYVAVIAMLAMVFLSQNVKRQLNSIENEFEKRKTDYEIGRPLREKFLALQKHLAALNDVRTNYGKALDHKPDTAGHMKAISNLIPKNIALTSLSVKQREKKDEQNKQKVYIDEVVILTGVAFQHNSMEGINLAQFLLDLEKSEYFYDIVLKSQKIRQDGNLEFVLECIV